MKNKLPETIRKTSIADLYIIERPTFRDERGFFHEIFRINELEQIGIAFNPVQVSHSFSVPRVIRAIHTEEWQKVIYPISGKIFAAFVDVRLESGSFGEVYTHEFNCDSEKSPHTAIYIPPGVGNSICVVGKRVVNYVYAVDEYWDNSKAQGIAWNDPDLDIKWPIKSPILSERDQNNPTLRELFPKKFK